MVILGDRRTAAQAVTPEATLVTGQLRARLKQQTDERKSTVAVKTPSANVEVGVGESKVDVDPQKATRLAVYRGAGNITAQRKKIDVAEGFGSKAEEGKAPTPPRPLPTSPSWVDPESLVMVDGSGKGALALGFTAAASETPATFHAQIARDDDFDDLLLDARMGPEAREVRANDLVPGLYRVRVSAVDGDEFEGAFSSVVTIVVASVRWQRHGHATVIDVEPKGLFCSVDSAAYDPVHAALSVESARAHQIRCAVSVAGIGAKVFDVPKDELAPGAPPAAPPTAPRDRVGVELYAALGAQMAGAQMAATGPRGGFGASVAFPTKAASLGVGPPGLLRAHATDDVTLSGVDGSLSARHGASRWASPSRCASDGAAPASCRS